MRNLLFFITLFISLELNAQLPIYGIDSSGLIRVNETLSSFEQNADIIDDYFFPVQTVQIGQTIYSIKLSSSDDDKEGGMHAIRVYNNGEKKIELKSWDVWTFTYDGGSSLDYRSYTDNRYFLTFDLSAKIKTLFFVGWPYDSDEPYLTIIVLTPNDAKCVFHQRMYIEKIDKIGGEYRFKCETKGEEYDSNGKLCSGPAEYTTLYSKDGILYLEQ